MAKLHDGIAHFFVLRDQSTDADTAFGVAFRHGVDENHVLLNAFEMTSGNIRRTGVDEFAIDLV